MPLSNLSSLFTTGIIIATNSTNLLNATSSLISGTNSSQSTSLSDLSDLLTTGMITTTATDQQHGGLSSGAIGGIVGGILGTLLLISVAATFYLLGRRNRTNMSVASPPSRNEAVEKPDEPSERPAGNLGNAEPIEGEVSGRLQYPNDETVEGGRLGSSV